MDRIVIRRIYDTETGKPKRTQIKMKGIVVFKEKPNFRTGYCFFMKTKDYTIKKAKQKIAKDWGIPEKDIEVELE